MRNQRLAESEYRFMLLVWEYAPIRSGDLVKVCEKELGWKKPTTYTVLRKLSEQGMVQNKDYIVTPLKSKEEVQTFESNYFMNRAFDGNLPEFVSAFLGNGKKLSDDDAKELKKLIDEHKA